MIKLGLIGYPVSHSLSPKIQNAALKACELEGEYSLYPIAPDDMLALKDLLDRVRSGEITGLNVTIPHKQNVIQFVDELTPTAKAIGAVNIIYLRGNKLIGDNTDAPGFLSDLKKFIGNRELEFGKSAIVLGAGGSARAVVYALCNDNWNVTIAARRLEQAQRLASQFTTSSAVELNLQTFKPSNFQLIVPHHGVSQCRTWYDVCWWRKPETSHRSTGKSWTRGTYSSSSARTFRRRTAEGRHRPGHREKSIALFGG